MSYDLTQAEESELIRKFLLIPYRHGGRTFQGADCAGGIILWYRHRLGIDLPDVQGPYPDSWKTADKNNFLEDYHLLWEKTVTPHKHDVILFKITPERLHAGIYLRDWEFLHICRAGCVRGKMDAPGWKNRMEGFYRYKALYENHRKIHS